MAEQIKGFLAYLLRIVPCFQHSVLIQCIPDSVQFLKQFMIFLRHLLIIIPFGQGRSLQHFKNEYRVMCRQSAPAFSNDIGMGNAVLVTGIDKRGNRVVHIFLDGVVHAPFAIGRTRTVIIHTQTTAYIHKFHFETHGMQLYIEL